MAFEINQAKTQEKVEALKRNWSDDPCWDIETTTGFEKYHDELLAFRLEKEKEWKEKAEAKRKPFTEVYKSLDYLISNREKANSVEEILAVGLSAICDSLMIIAEMMWDDHNKRG